MTEIQWLTSDDPAAMLHLLSHQPARGGNPARPRDKPLASDRKLRLWAEACRRLDVGMGGTYHRDLHDPEQLRDALKGWCKSWSADRVPMGARADLLREVVGNPFLVVTFDPLRRTPEVLALAGGAYDSLDWGGLPALADAAQDAGCEDGELLLHLRGPGPHCRGCWALDLILGKS